MTALAVGTCTVTCSATDGSGIKADCVVTVFQPVTSITLNHDRLSLSIGESETLSATILPANATNKNITWSSNKTNVATVDQTGKVKAVAGGTCTITCSATDGSGVCALCYVSVFEEHEYVDLGLPSGTLWATCNVGASSPEEYGDYFAWGETEPKSDYSWNTYKYCNGTSSTMTKYCTDSEYGMVDNKTVLESGDDAATTNWNNNWQMPSKAQIEELINSSYTTTELTTLNGVEGRMITSKVNGKSIFLPAAGMRGGTSTTQTSIYGEYWSRSLSPSTPNRAYDLSSHSNINVVEWVADYRFVGRSVRPVHK